MATVTVTTTKEKLTYYESDAERTARNGSVLFRLLRRRSVQTYCFLIRRAFMSGRTAKTAKRNVKRVENAPASVGDERRRWSAKKTRSDKKKKSK